MHHLHRLCAALAVATLATACATPDHVAGPTVPARAAARDIDPSSTEGAGAIIVHDERSVFFVDFDAAHQLLAVHMPVWDTFLCGGSSFFDISDRTVISTPSEIQQFLVKITDDESSVGVYHATSKAEAGIGAGINRAVFCSFISSGALIAQGTARHLQNLSNASFESHWGGQLSGPDGTTYAYSETYQLTADAHAPNDPTQWVENVTDIKLSALPR